MEQYFTNLDLGFPEIAGVPFRFQTAIFLGPKTRVFGRELIWLGSGSILKKTLRGTGIQKIQYE